KGERVDGHDFVSMAAAKGAAAALVMQPTEAQIPCITVDDTLRAYGDLAKGYRQMHPVKVIGITGSVGKTTTKEMMACALESTYRTAKTEGNHNNALGLPMSIMDMPADTQIAVLEMGMNHFGEMAYLTSIAKPNYAIVTNIGTMHIEHLGSREGILQAKMEIMQGVAEDGIGVFNGDEPLLWNIKDQGTHKKYYYGIENKSCDVVANDIQELDDGMRFRVSGLGHEFELFVPVVGRHAVYNALAAVTTALLLNVKPEKLQVQFSSFQNTGMRQKIYEKNGMTIIEDCYNAGPESMEAALGVLESQKTEGRRIAVLGDMLELGNRSSAEHYRIGRLAASKADMLLAFGSNSVRTVTGAVTGGMNPKNAEHFDTHEDLVHVLKSRAREGDVLLFKGSRGMRMECALELFLKDH
ncbi:MAG: UDP-N-acetylmuramoyl-tripeptide--D-alanyl-D-alanine ligase, partial [Oscillospiraceae bacterium]|nr:UDP-N-acetylmuramoyl-tripeptide--D-alanyl-D-alanine ligase [Oscillospiraceae bacterium]